MKRLLLVFVCLSLMSSSALASSAAVQKVQDVLRKVNGISNTTERSVLFEQVFLQFADDFGTVSFREVDIYLKEAGFQPSLRENKSEYMKHELVDDNGCRLLLTYYPIDSSMDSKEFDNPDKEMLMLMEYALADKSKSITITDEHHSGMKMVTFDKNRKPANETMYNLSGLLDFYHQEMGGYVTEEYYATNSQETENARLAEIKMAVLSKAKQLHKVSVEKVTLHSNELQIHFVWNNKETIKGHDYLKQTLIEYSDTLALAAFEEDKDLEKIYVFFDAPHIYDVDSLAKITYESFSTNKLYRTEEYGPLFR